MNIYQAIKKVKAVHVAPDNVDLISLLFDSSGIILPIKSMDISTSKDGELILIFEGSAKKSAEYKLDVSNGLSINEIGEGYLRLPDKRYLFSFWQYLIEDTGNVAWKNASCFIPFNPSFTQLRTAYDYFLNQEGRVTQGFEKEDYIHLLAKQGVTHVEVNGLGYPMGLENGPKGETYPMFYTYCPAMDQFVYSELNKGLYPFYYLSTNLANMKQNAA